MPLRRRTRAPSSRPEPWAQVLARHISDGGTPAPPVVPVPGRRISTPWLVALVAGLVALPGAGGTAAYLAVENHDRAAGWRERAVLLEDLVADRTRALNRQTARLNAAATTLRNTRTAVRRSEEDVAELEQRQRELADEKAQIEDQRAFLEGLTAQLESERTALLDVAGQLESCNVGLGDLLVTIADGFAPFPGQVDDVVATCDAADVAVAGYQQTFAGR